MNRTTIAGLLASCALAVGSPTSALACRPDAGPEYRSYECIDAGMGVAISCASHDDCPEGLSCSAMLACACASCAAEECDDAGSCRCASGLADPGAGCRWRWVLRECLSSGAVIAAHWERVCPDADAGALDAGVEDTHDAGMDAGMDAASDAGPPIASAGCSIESRSSSGVPSITLMALALIVVRRRVTRVTAHRD
jgi:hypothetical protein